MLLAELSPPATAAARPAPARRRADVVRDVLAYAVAAAPFVVVAVAYGLTGHLVLGGDQALTGLDALDARHLDQFVGPYSRMGWAHPGPAWFYLLAPVYWISGSTGQGLVAASLLLHALFAVLLVAAAGRERPWQRPLMAGLVLLYVLRMPAVDFVAVWNPFTLLLPVALLLLLAARACAGSLPAFAASLAVGSFLLQTHIGTAPLVGLVALLELAAVGVRLVRDPAARRLGRDRRAVAAGAALSVLLWVPPVVQQLTASGKGNLRMIGGYFLHGGSAGEGTHGWHEAVSTVGQMLGASVFGWPAEPALVKTTILTPAVVAGVLVQLVGGVAVAVVGRRLGERVLSWTGALVSAGTVAALVAARTVTGPMLNYLVLWATVLPLVLLFAGVSLAVLSWRRAPVRAVSGLAVGLLVLGALGSVGVGMSLRHASTTRLYDEPGAAQAAHLATAALPPARSTGSPVLLDIRDISAWTMATSVGLELERAGYHVTVARQWSTSFGSDRLSAGHERYRVVLQPVADAHAGVSGQEGVVVGLNGPVAVLVDGSR